MAANTIGLNQTFPIYNENGTPFHNLVLRKGVVDSVVMSLGDKITGDVYYSDNTLAVTMKEYIEFNGIKYSLVNPPTVVREGVVSDNSELKGMTKYSFEFYHPMYMLANFPFTDVATTVGEEKYLSQNKVFSWIGKPQDFIDKLNKNLQGTVWCVRKSDRFPSDKNNELSDVLTFDNATVAEAIKIGYETWDIPYVVTQIPQTDPLYAQGKRFVVEYGLPSNEIYENDSQRQLDNPFVFRMGKGVGLKNNSRTPRNNKIITRIAGYGSEDNVPYGYPQIVWTGNQDWDYTINNDPNEPLSYPIYKGIVGGQYVKLIKHPFTRTHLMPSIYTDTVNKKVNPYATGYDPTIEIKDYYDAVASQQYPYVNEINLQAPSYDSHEFPDIKPEFDSESSIGIISAIPLNSDLTPADHWDDSMDDDGNYLQSYFQITLPQLDFDLYACAAITQEMQINMRSGACIGCTFTVQVDWDDYKANFYDSDGNFLPDGEQRDLTKYPKSNLGQISVVVQKDNTTFGTLMPNIYQQPVANDLFVFIGISLPLSYITDAEERLDDAMKTYMLENNVFYFDYPLKFDEHFLATNTYILEQIRPNSIIRFEYGGVQQKLFVKQLTVKYGNAALPQYDITLTDNIEVVLNQIGQVADDVEKLSSLLSLLRQSYSRNVWNELAKKLSKTQDDTASGYIRMLKGLQVGANFVPDILGEGGVLRMRSDGKVELVTDILYARMKAYFDTVEIREYQHTAGNRIASVAGNKCVRVAWFNSSNVELEQTQANLSSVAYFRCFFRASDGEDTVRNNFKVGDQAYCHITSVDGSSDNPEQKGFNQKHYWRLVVGRNVEGTLTDDNEGWIDLSNRSEVTIGGINYQGYQSGSDVPQAQDDIIQLGNVNDTTRQGAIVEYVTGTDAPSYQIYQGINSFSLNGKNYVRLGYDSQSGGAQAYIGNPNGSSYLWYHLVNGTPKLEIKAKVEITSTESTIDGTPISQYDFYDDTQIWNRIADMQEQIDGEIDTWFYEGTPTLSNVPASNWNTDILKERHLGDLYYDMGTGQTAGFAYRFIRTGSEGNWTYSWQYLEDTAITEALALAARAQDTADHKRRVFICDASHQTPTPPYDAGDLWVNVKYPWATGATYDDEILKCIKSVPRTEGGQQITTFNINDWSLANGYTSKLNDFVNNTYAPFTQTIQGQVDKKAETWRQESDPSTPWYDDTQTPVVDVRIHHVGDLWYNTGNNNNFKYQGTYIYENTGTDANPVYGWVEEAIPDEVFDKIDGKATIFVNNPNDTLDRTPYNYKANDLWILGGGMSLQGHIYKQGDVLTAIRDNTTFSGLDWVKKIRYTDDSEFEGYINQILGNQSYSSGDDATAAAAQKVIIDAISGDNTIITGGLVMTSIIALKNGNTVWSGISGKYDSTLTGGGIAAWFGGAMVDHEVNTTAVDYAKSLFRFDGSGYLASGGISWNSENNLKINLKSDSTSGIPSFNMLSGNSNESLVLEEFQSSGDFVKWYGLAASSEVLGYQGDFLTVGVNVRNDNTGRAKIVLCDTVLSSNVPIAPNVSILTPDFLAFRYREQGATETIGTLATIGIYNTGSYAGCIDLKAQHWLRRAIKNDGSFESGTAYVDTYGYLRVKGLGDTNEGDPGSGGGGGGTTLNEPLASINALNANPQYAGMGLIYESNGWTQSNLKISNGTIYIGSGSITPVTSSTFGTVFSSYCHDNYVNISNFWNDAGYITSYVDTKNTAGSTNSTSKLYLIGATSQAANPQTYSNEYVYVYDGTLFATKPNYGLSFGGHADISETGQDEIVFYSSNTISINAGNGVYINGSQPATQSWVTSQGYVTASALNGYATQSWVTSQGYIQPTLSNLSNGDVLIYDSVGSWVNTNLNTTISGFGYITSSALSGYATQAWVNQQGFLTSSALNGYIHPTLTNLANGDILVYDSVGAWVNVPISSFLSGYATQSWVNQQGFSKFNPTINSPQNRDIVVYESGCAGWLNASLDTLLSGYATQTWVGQQGYITGITSSMITTALGYTPANGSNYLPLTGGTLTGVLTIAPTNTGAQQLGLRLHDNGGGGSECLWIQWTSASYLDGVKLLGRPDVQDLQFINSSGTWYTVWHSGNLTNNNQLTNGAGYITSTALNGYIHPTLTNLADGNILVYDAVAGNWVNTSWPLTGYATRSWVQQQGYITSSASITGNASTATKLQTARTIWGQSFDGTSDITGKGYIGTGYNTETPCADLLEIHSYYTSSSIEWSVALKNDYNSDSYRGGVGLKLALGATTEGNNKFAGIAAVSESLWIERVGLAFYTSNYPNAYERLRITGLGNVGIGTTTPSYLLDVNGSANATTLYENGSRVITTANIGSQSVNYATSAGSANILGQSVTTQSGHALSNGDILIYDSGIGWVNASSSYISDIRKKDVINYNAEPTFEAVANAPAIRFTYKDARYSFNQGVKVGSIAQYWKTELPEAVNEDKEGYLSMQYEVLGLLAAIAVAKRVTNHERRIESLERENALLRLELNKIKAA